MSRYNRPSLAGKSLIINCIVIALNILGLTFLVMGYHPSFVESATTYKLLGYGLMGLSLITIHLLEGWFLFAQISRIIVGGLFIVSGLIKANDPIGFSYKLEEYFEDGALAYRIKEWFHWDTFSLEFLIQHALGLSVIICIFEIVLGALILLGAKFKTSTWLMLFMMLFFTFLTWHTKECDPTATFTDRDTYALSEPIAQIKIEQAAHNENIKIVSKTANKVTIEEIKKTQCVDDCGCFGDAMKGSIGRSLTPAESYWKDIVLLYLVIILFISRRKIELNTQNQNIIMIVFGLLFISFFSYIFSWFFPILFGGVILLVGVWIKQAGGKYFGNAYGIILSSTALCAIFVSYVLLYSPLKDYRPYHVGSNLIERMNDGREGVYENLMVYTNVETNKDTTISALDESTKFIWGDAEKWKFSKRETKTIIPAILPSIQQFDPAISVSELSETEREFEPIAEILANHQVQYIDLIERSSNNHYPMLLEDFYLPDIDTAIYTVGDTILQLSEEIADISLKDYILSQDQILIVFCRNFSSANFGRIDKLKEIAQKAKENNIPMVMISTESMDAVNDFRKRTELIIPTLQNDETEIKAITRSNPTLMVLNNGVVKGKFPFRSTPSWEWLIQNMLKIEK
ncbi:MAG: DoxX family protein [Brumimicrobium sp.]|nr:DoxX family protein [Brumimicrobium sp.]